MEVSRGSRILYIIFARGSCLLGMFIYRGASGRK